MNTKDHSDRHKQLIDESGISRKTVWYIKHRSQYMSLLVGGIFIFMGAWGLFFDGFLGVQAKMLYWAGLIASGSILAYFGHKDNSLASFITCLILATMCSVMVFINFYPEQTVHATLMANYHDQGSFDYLINVYIAVVLFGGAIDWFRRYRSHRNL